MTTSSGPSALTSLFDVDHYDARRSKERFAASQQIRRAKKKQAEIEGKRAKPNPPPLQLIDVLGIRDLQHEGDNVIAVKMFPVKHFKPTQYTKRINTSYKGFTKE